MTKCMGRIVDTHSHDRESNGARTCMAIVDHGNPGTWHGTPATVPMSLCAYDVEVLDGLLGALDRLPRVCLMAIDGVGRLPLDVWPASQPCLPFFTICG